MAFIIIYQKFCSLWLWKMTEQFWYFPFWYLLVAPKVNFTEVTEESTSPTQNWKSEPIDLSLEFNLSPSERFSWTTKTLDLSPNFTSPLKSNWKSDLLMDNLDFGFDSRFYPHMIWHKISSRDTKNMTCVYLFVCPSVLNDTTRFQMRLDA